MTWADDEFLFWKAILVFAWLALVFLAERMIPAAREPSASLPGPEAPQPGLWRLGRNGAFWGINLVISPLVVLPLTAWSAGHAVPWRPDWWSGGLGLALDILMLDALIYWWHRANHVIPFLWRFHQVHHLDRFLDSTTALRFHFGEVFLSALARAGIVILLDVPFASVLAFEALLLMATVFHHSNLRLPTGFERALSWIIVTPSIHWVHHHARRVDTDSNYATIFSLWDRLFGSRSPNPRRLDMTIGVEGVAEQRFFKLLLRPFRPARDRA